MRRLPLLVASLLLVTAPAHAQGGGAAASPEIAALEARLPSLSGRARVHALARLTQALESDRPQRAADHGAEALALLATLRDDTARVQVLNERGWALMTLGRYDSATASLGAARTLARRVGLRAGEARALSNLGSMAQRRGDPERAVTLFEQALALQRAVGDRREIANSLNNLGFVASTDLADYGRALEAHLEALRLRETLGDRAAIALSLNNIGIVYARLRQWDRALDYFGRALAVRRALGAPARVAATLDNIGSVWFDRGDPAAALAPHRESLRLRETIPDRSAAALAHRNVGLVHLALGATDSARRHLTEALRLGDSVGDRGLMARGRLALSELARRRGRPDEAVRLTRAALAIADSMKSRELVRRAWEELARAEEARGALRAALDAFRAAKVLGDSIYDETTARRVGELERRYETERREREIDRLRRAQAEQRLESAQRTTQRNAALAIAALVGALAVVGWRSRAGRLRLAEALSLTDSLTGVRNRRYVQQTIAADLAASLRRHRASLARATAPVDADLVFLLVDVDHFKQVNDRHGHAVGDRMLVAVARALEGTCRASDVVARWGGEEFLVLSRAAERTRAGVFAERVRRAVAAASVRLPDGQDVRVTCSVGYAVFPLAAHAPAAMTLEQVLLLADRGVYAAKQGGRDRCVGYVADEAAAADAPAELPADDAGVRAALAAGWLREERPTEDAVAVVG